MSQSGSPSSPGSLRVALVSGSLPLGGSTTFVCNLAGELVRRGIAATVLSFERDNPFAPDFERLRVPVCCLDHRRLIYEDRLAIVWQELQQFKPTVVIANLASTSFEVLRYVPTGVYRCGMIHADQQAVYDSLGIYAPVLDAMAVVSRNILEKVRPLPAYARIAVPYLPYGVPMPAHQSPRRFTKPLRILYLGRLIQEQKRVRLFPEILAQLCQTGIPFHWTIAGEGPEAAWLQQSVRPTNPQQTVSFRGAVSYGEVPALLDDHDVYLLASDYEGLPLSLLEAMGRGLVPVVSDLPSGINEVVDDTNGKRIAIEDVEGYARAILELDSDRERMATMSIAAQDRVRKEFSVEALTDRWLEALAPAVRPPVPWPALHKIKPILGVQQPLYYSPPVRILRRLAIRLRG